MKPVKVPSVGESVSQATLAQWQKKHGEYVHQNEVLVLMETDKASMDLVAEYSGKLHILKPEGEDVKVGELIAQIDTKAPAPKKNTASSAPPRGDAVDSRHKRDTPPLPAKKDSSPSAEEARPQLLSPTSPSLRKWARQQHMDISQVAGTGRKGRITKQDLQAKASSPPPVAEKSLAQKRRPMSTLRKRIAERLVASQKSTATLTTFNEVDMSRIITLRSQHKESFKEKYQVKLGFMGFFIKAVTRALKQFPRVNAFIDGTDIVYSESCHIGVAVSTEKGLVVPVIKEAQNMSLAELEQMVNVYAQKAREARLSPDDLSGGTFTISNGGVFGSLMSTPILNPPQSGILGMHKIQARPVAVDGQVQIRPMMYVALSYDHRIVDGKESVSFLQTVKDSVEDPVRLFIGL